MAHSMSMRDTDNVMDEQQSKPMGPGPDPDAKALPEAPAKERKWVRWLILIVVGIVIGVAVSLWLF